MLIKFCAVNVCWPDQLEESYMCVLAYMHCNGGIRLLSDTWDTKDLSESWPPWYADLEHAASHILLIGLWWDKCVASALNGSWLFRDVPARLVDSLAVVYWGGWYQFSSGMIGGMSRLLSPFSPHHWQTAQWQLLWWDIVCIGIYTRG